MLELLEEPGLHSIRKLASGNWPVDMHAVACKVPHIQPQWSGLKSDTVSLERVGTAVMRMIQMAE